MRDVLGISQVVLRIEGGGILDYTLPCPQKIFTQTENIYTNIASLRQTTEVEGGYEFECQHGPEECAGNLVQACTIAHAPDYDTQVRLIVCMMSSPSPNTAGPECFQEFGLDYQPIQASC